MATPQEVADRVTTLEAIAVTEAACAAKHAAFVEKLDELTQSQAILRSERKTSRTFWTSLIGVALALTAWSLTETIDLRSKAFANEREHEKIQSEWSDVKEDLRYIRTRIDEIAKK